MPSLPQHSVPSAHTDGVARCALQVVILSRGAHLLEYGLDEVYSRHFHVERANGLAEVLQRVISPHHAEAHTKLHTEPEADGSPSSNSVPVPDAGATVVYVHAHWGASPWSHAPAEPLQEPPHPPSNFSWDGVPLINSVTMAQLRQRLPSRKLIFVDPTRAISMRSDCRMDPLHVNPEIYLASTWRMVQNALTGT